MVVGIAGSGSVLTVPQAEWKGSSFIADEWDLPYRKIADVLGFKTRYSDEEARKLLVEAIACCKEAMF
jgi:hypothetical protein